MNTDLPAEAKKMWKEKHEEWVAKVAGAKLVAAEKSGHFIQV